MAGKSHLGAFEQLVLLAALRLEREAFAPRIAALIEDRARRDVSRGALYATLDRLESKGLVDWRVERATARRAGMRRRRFRVTPAGIRALAASRRTLLDLWSGLESVLSEVSR